MGGVESPLYNKEQIMFFQFMIYILIFVAFILAVWKWIIRPILEGLGIQVDEEPEVKTEHTKRLKKTKEEHKEKSASVHAVREEKNLKEELSKMDEEIKETERKIKNK